MSLQDLVNNFGVEKEYSEEEKNEQQLLSLLLKERIYLLLLKFLNECGIVTTGDLKKLDTIEYNLLKAKIPTIPGVGEDKTDLFLSKLDEIRNTKYEFVEDENNFKDDTINYGILGDPTKWHIEINSLKFDNCEYVDIRKTGPDGSRGKGISIKKENFETFKEIINNITFNENSNSVNEEIYSPIQEIVTFEEDVTSSNKEQYTDNLEEMFLSQLDNDSLKDRILKNEDKLYEEFKDDFGLAIKYFKAKIESLREDGDIVKFLENPSILDIKKDQYDKTHSRGLKTAIDIKNEYDKTNLKYTTINDLNKNEEVNSMMICSIVNNFNVMLGMYYDELTKSLILKCQIKDGPYEDRWIEKDKVLYYCLQNETDENFAKLSFSKYPNTVCKNIIFGYDLDTKVYLFYRYNKSDNYTYAGEVKLEKFTNGNKAIIVNIPEENSVISSGWKQDVLDCINRINKDVFSLEDIYDYELELQMLHPDNSHVREKIRQQLQFLRNDGIIEFIENGKYKKN